MPQNLLRESGQRTLSQSEATSGESTMEALLGALAFTAFILAQVAAIVAVHAERERRQPHPVDATRPNPRARIAWDCGD
jgi:hypothetical protein